MNGAVLDSDGSEVIPLGEMTFGEAVRLRRVGLGLSLKAVAGDLGVSVSYLSMMERGVSRPFGREVQVAALASILDIDADDLAELARQGRQSEADRLRQELDDVRAELRQAYERCASMAENCAHSCASEKHCDFLHAAHRQLAEDIRKAGRRALERAGEGR